MNFLRFLVSKSLWISILIAFALIGGLGYGILRYLNSYTDHNKEIQVIDLTGLNYNEAQEKLNILGLEALVIDTTDFNEKYPPLSVVYQEPKANISVKEGRIVYIKLNAKNYSSVKLPNLVDNTFRFALSRIENLELKKGVVRYEPHLAKDVVIQVEQDGRILKEGDKVVKNSSIDFVLGDGSLSFKPQANDSLDIFEDVAPKVDSIY